jgi:hypothetical protein
MRINQCSLQQQGLTDKWACHACGRLPREDRRSRSTGASGTPYSPRGCNLLTADGYFLLCAVAARLTEPHPTSVVKRAQVFPEFRHRFPRPPAWKICDQAIAQPSCIPHLTSGGVTASFLHQNGSSLSVSWTECTQLDLQAVRTTLISMRRVTYRKPSAPV